MHCPANTERNEKRKLFQDVRRRQKCKEHLIQKTNGQRDERLATLEKTLLALEPTRVRSSEFRPSLPGHESRRQDQPKMDSCVWAAPVRAGRAVWPGIAFAPAA